MGCLGAGKIAVGAGRCSFAAANREKIAGAAEQKIGSIFVIAPLGSFRGGTTTSRAVGADVLSKIRALI